MTDHLAPRSLLDLTPVEARATLARWVAERGLPRYRADQMHAAALGGSGRELGRKPPSFRLALRAELDQTHPLPRLREDVIQQSADGTRKYLWRLGDGEAIESVLIPSRRPADALHLLAGRVRAPLLLLRHRPMGYRRNLTPFEIAGQVREIVLRTPEDKPTNIVFMGMGEPLLNWPAVRRRAQHAQPPEGFGIGARHITVSTVGILPGMAELAKRPEQFRLAISLHAPTSAAAARASCRSRRSTTSRRC